MAWILAAAAVICAVVLLRRWNSAPRKAFETVAPPVPGAAAVPAGEVAVTATEMEDMNRAARERRRNALIARWWNC